MVSVNEYKMIVELDRETFLDWFNLINRSFSREDMITAS